MSYVPLLLSLMAVDLLAAMSPGPNFVLVTRTAIQRARRHAGAVVIFALFMKPATPAWVQFAAVGIVLFDTALWYGTVALLFSSGGVKRVYLRIQRPVNRLTGAVMVVFGARLVLGRENIP